MSLKIAMVAGETSGDQLACHLIAALKARLPDAEFHGIGGPRMQGQGFDAWWPMEKLAVMGFVEVLRHYREISRIRSALKSRLLADPPDVFIGVDAPDFNLGLEKALKKRGIPTIHYVSPSVWAWRKKRVNKIARSADRLLALFPIEPPLYADAGIPVSFVGHPMADEIPTYVDRLATREKLNIEGGAARPIFALLPGSRQSELRYMADTFVQTAKLVFAAEPKAMFLVPFATRETRELFEIALYKHEAQNLPIRMMFGHARDAVAAADVCLVASGTATLETALVKRPMVVTYKMAKWSFRLMKRMSYLPYFSLPNVLAGRFVLPEILQDEATPEHLSNELLTLYRDPLAQEAQVAVFEDIHFQLRQNTAEKAADAVLETLGLLKTGLLSSAVDEAEPAVVPLTTSSDAD
ncbi:MAG: lipid-A-disaccharide synthase [Pseudomonadota bacterium]|jgi:lipid-A-disaccharide synthase